MAWPKHAVGMGRKEVLCFCFSAFFIICFCLPLASSGDLSTDAQALLRFKESTGNNETLSTWNNSSISIICTNWTGVSCSNVSSTARVTALRLPALSLSGQISPSTLGNLDTLQTLTLTANRFNGELPSDLANCIALANLSLQNNSFSGPLSASAFSAWPLLVQIDLSFNKFNGTIPQSITNATKLQSINLQNNFFSGAIPAITSTTLQSLDVANNELEGQIPTSLSRFGAGSFEGNKELCGEPLNDKCGGGVNAQSPAPSPLVSSATKSKSKSNSLSGGAIVGIVIGSVMGVVLFGLIARKAKSKRVHVITREQGQEASVEGPNKEEEGLVYVDTSMKKAFDMESLLRASAEVMGKGILGMAYKAMLDEGLVFVVKRLNFECKDDYRHRLFVLSNLHHPHLVPLKAWYFSKDEKFLVYDFLPHGNLHSHLHGKKPMEWERRLKVAGTVANVLAYIHSQNVVHGDIKASNVLMNSEDEACLIDYGLVPLAVRLAARNTGYTPPEITDLSRMTIKGDVYSFGVLLLELLTGKPPLAAPSNNGGTVDLPRWVQSVVQEQWTAEVFDLEIMKFEYIQEEMMELLKKALQCVSPSPDQRPSMVDLVIAIEGLRSSDCEDSI